MQSWRDERKTSACAYEKYYIDSEPSDHSTYVINEVPCLVTKPRRAKILRAIGGEILPLQHDATEEFVQNADRCC